MPVPWIFQYQSRAIPPRIIPTPYTPTIDKYLPEYPDRITRLSPFAAIAAVSVVPVLVPASTRAGCR
jgi:hypothetical protein